MMSSNNQNFPGYGSTSARTRKRDPQQNTGIDTVLGGQIWRVQPDEQAKAAHPCLWMQTGVVSFKPCTNFYDCTTCAYDRAMHKKAATGKARTWQEAMRRMPDKDRLCRHSLTGRVGRRSCPYNYECSHCDFDQYVEEVLSSVSIDRPEFKHQVKGFQIPEGYMFHIGHTWARVESGGSIRIGMDDFAMKVLGSFDRFELPVMGKVVEQAEPAWGLSRGNHEAEALSPVEGIIMDVNQQVREYPGAAFEKPYEDGWLMLVRHNDIKSMLKRLMDEEQSLNWLSQEVATLEHMIEEVHGPLAADGGLLQPDVFGNCPELGWNSLTKTFLRS